MSQAAVFSTCQMPCRFGLTFDVRGVAGACAATWAAGKARNTASTTLANPYRIREPPCAETRIVAPGSRGVMVPSFLYGVFDWERKLDAAGSARSAPTGRRVRRYGAGNVLLLARVFPVTVWVSRHSRSCPAGNSPGSIGCQLVLKAPCWFTSTYSVVLRRNGSIRSTTLNSTRPYAPPWPSAFTRTPLVWVLAKVQVPE